LYNPLQVERKAGSRDLDGFTRVCSSGLLKDYNSNVEQKDCSGQSAELVLQMTQVSMLLSHEEQESAMAQREREAQWSYLKLSY
jgi:hypothetical protein